MTSREAPPCGREECAGCEMRRTWRKQDPCEAQRITDRADETIETRGPILAAILAMFGH